MVRHVVMWKLRDRDAAPGLKARLEELNGRIPGLIRLEVGIDVSQGEQSADLVLISEHDNLAALAAYQAHPEHLAIGVLMREAALSRIVVDYEI